MNDALYSVEVIYSYLTALAIAIPRTFALFSILPIMTRLGLPRILQFIIITALCLPIVAPLSAEIRSAPAASALSVAALCFKEAFVGLLIGLAIGVPFWIIEVAGNIADFIRQAPDALVQDPQNQTESTITGTLFSIFATLYFIAMGGLTVIVEIIYKSYELWPALGAWPVINENAPAIVLLFLDRIFHAGFIIAGPLVIVTLTTFVIVAIISRFTPQMNFFDLSLSSRNIAFVIAMQVYTIYIISYFNSQSEHLRDTLDIVKGILHEQ
jgi:type III secretion protein T